MFRPICVSSLPPTLVKVLCRAFSALGSSLPPPSLLYTDLRDNPGAKTRQRRKGRGVGSGHGLGRSAGLGTRGQNSHGGGLAITFEGGQSPLWRRTPKFGQMHKMFRAELEPLNLDRLQLWIDTGRLDVSQCVGRAPSQLSLARARPPLLHPQPPLTTPLPNHHRPLPLSPAGQSPSRCCWTVAA